MTSRKKKLQKSDFDDPPPSPSLAAGESEMPSIDSEINLFAMDIDLDSNDGEDSQQNSNNNTSTILKRIVPTIFKGISTIFRFSLAFFGLVVGVILVIINESIFRIYRFGLAALVRSHYQPRDSLDDAVRVLNRAKRNEEDQRFAIEEATRLIREATLCPLAYSAEERVFDKLREKGLKLVKKPILSNEEDERPEPFRLVNRNDGWFSDLKQCWGKQHNRQQSIPSLNDREHMKETVLHSDKVESIIEKLSEGDTAKVKDYCKEAERLYDEMAAKPSLKLVRLCAWFIAKIFGLLYSFGVEVDLRQVRRVQAVARQAGIPIVYLPTHKSHTDYLLVSFVCLCFDLPLPHVVSGINLNLPVIGPILRRGGAFFIRRSFGGDELYSAIFDAYVTVLLRHGMAVECFVEGGRSRSGKVLPPKTGFLQTLVKSVESGDVPDAIIVPISLNYDRVVEGRSMSAELAGSEKKAERLVSAIVATMSLIRDTFTGRLTFGRVDIGFAEPFSVRNFLRERAASRLPSSSSNSPNKSIKRQSSIDLFASSSKSAEARLLELSQSGGDDNAAPHSLAAPVSLFTRAHLEKAHSLQTDAAELLRSAKFLGYKTLYHCNRVAVILPTALVGTVLLTQYERGIAMSQLIRRVNWLQNEVLARGYRVVNDKLSSPGDYIRKVIDQVLSPNKSIAGDSLVKRHKNLLLLSVYSPKERLELTLLRNSLLHVFVDEAIVCCALYGSEKIGSSPIRRDELYERFKWLTLLLSFEFVFEPIPRSTVSKRRYSAAVEILAERGVLKVAKGEDRGSDLICVDDAQIAGKDMNGTMTYLFYCSLLWSFIDTYFVASLALLTLTSTDDEPPIVISLGGLVSRAQLIGEQLYFEGMLDLFEAISKEQLQHAFNLYKHWSIIQPVRGDVRGLVSMTKQYRNIDEVLTLVNRVAFYKKKARAYRSRRFKAIAGSHEVNDAIRRVRATKWTHH